MKWPLHVTVAAIIEREGRFLMVQEVVHGKTVLNQPAGHLEQHESLLDAVVRETLEETAWHFQPESLVGVYRWVHPHGDTFLRFCFAGSLLQQEPNRQLDTGIERTLWLDHAELQTHAEQLRSPLVLHCINDYLAGTRISLNVLKDVFE